MNSIAVIICGLLWNRSHHRSSRRSGNLRTGDGSWATGFRNITLGSLPERAARRWGAREALVFQGRRWSFAELSAGVDRLARGLIGLGVTPGEKIALWMVNRPEFIEAMFAVIKIGAVLVPINTRFRTDDVAYVLGQSDAATLIVAERSGPIDYLGMVRELVPSLAGGAVRESRFPNLRRVISVGDAPRARRFPGAGCRRPATRSVTTALADAGRGGRSRRRGALPVHVGDDAGSPRARCTTTRSSAT